MPANLYKRGKTYWGRIQVNGAEHRRSLRTTVFAEAKERLKKLIEEANHIRYSGAARHSWKEAVAEWEKQPGVKASVVDRYLASIGKARGILDPLYVDEIDRAVIGRIARRPGVTNATRRRDLTAVSAVLRWCVAHDWVEINHAKIWDRSVIKERRNPIVLPDDADIDAVVAEAPAGLAAMVRWAQYTGMRMGECVSLDRSQVDLRRMAVNLGVTKTDRPRSLPLDERAVGTYSGTPAYVGSPVVFWHDAGERYVRPSNQFLQVTYRVAAKAKKARKPFRAFRFHDLRHLYAVDYLRRGGSIYVLQKLLGHSSIATTEIYLDYLTPEEQEVAKAAQK